MDPIDVELLSSAQLTTLVPYGTSEEDANALVTSEKQPPSPIEESPNNQGLSLKRNLIRTPIETNVSNTEHKETKEDEPDSC